MPIKGCGSLKLLRACMSMIDFTFFESGVRPSDDQVRTKNDASATLNLNLSGLIRIFVQDINDMLVMISLTEANKGVIGNTSDPFEFPKDEIHLFLKNIPTDD